MANSKPLYRTLAAALLTSTLALGSASIAVAQSTATQDIKHAGSETKDATKSTGHAIVKGTKVGARKTKNGTKKVAHGTARVTKKAAAKVEGKPAPQ